MGVSVVFEGGSAEVGVVPGESAECFVRVENTGMVVDRVLLDVLGDAAEWVSAEPAQINLLPGASERVRLSLRPPRLASLAPGEVPFGLRAMSTEDPDGSRIEEGAVIVGEFAELAAQLVPKSSAGRRSARFRLSVENRGNRPENLRIEAFDPDAKLRLRTSPEVFVAPPGTATFVHLKSVPRKTFFRGPNRTLPFEVSALPEEGEPAKAEGVMVERQTLPEWLLPLLGIAALACVLLLALWFTVLRPVVHSAATAAAQAQNAANSANSAAKAVKSANAAAPSALNLKLAAPTIVTGATDQATVTGTFANGSGSLPKLVWTSSAPNVATVSQNGVVTALSPGSATITAASAGGSGGPAPGGPNQGPATAPPATGPADAALGLAAATTADPSASATGTAAGPAGGSGSALPVAALSGSATVNIVGPVSVSTATVPGAALGKPYSQPLNATGGTGSFTWSISAGALPPGLELAPGTGVISGTPTQLGTTSFTVHLADAGPPAQYTTRAVKLSVVNALAVNTSSLPGAVVGTAYQQALTAVGGTVPITWSLVPGQGSLPAGLSLNPAGGVISGTPTQAGTSQFVMQVSDAAKPSQTSTEALSITVSKPLDISTQTLPDVQLNVQYDQSLVGSGGSAPYTWTVSSGSLPKGLTLDPSSGTISGIPTAAGTYTITVTLTDSGSPHQSLDSPAYTFHVSPAFVITTSSLPEAVVTTPGTAYTAAVQATGGAGAYHFTETGSLPPGIAFSDGAFSGTATATGSYPITLSATDSSSPPQTGTLQVTVSSVNALSFTTTTLNDATTNTAYAQSLAAVGGAQPYTFTIAQGSLPGNGHLSLSGDGQLTGTPDSTDATCSYGATVVCTPAQVEFEVSDGGSPPLTTDITMPVNIVGPLGFTVPTRSAVVGSPYTGAVPQATGGDGSYTWAVTGTSALPAGFTLNADGSITTGTSVVTAADGSGSQSFTLTMTDTTSGQAPDSQSDSILISPRLTANPALPNPLVLTESDGSTRIPVSSPAFPATFSENLSGLSTPLTMGGFGNFSYSVSAGSPGLNPSPGGSAATLDGLQMSSNGVLSGQPGDLWSPGSPDNAESQFGCTSGGTCVDTQSEPLTITVTDSTPGGTQSISIPAKITFMPSPISISWADNARTTGGTQIASWCIDHDSQSVQTVNTGVAITGGEGPGSYEFQTIGGLPSGIALAGHSGGTGLNTRTGELDGPDVTSWDPGPFTFDIVVTTGGYDQSLSSESQVAPPAQFANVKINDQGAC